MEVTPQIGAEAIKRLSEIKRKGFSERERLEFVKKRRSILSSVAQKHKVSVVDLSLIIMDWQMENQAKFHKGMRDEFKKLPLWTLFCFKVKKLFTGK